MRDLTGEKSAARKIAFSDRELAHSVAASRRGAANLINFLIDWRGQPISGYMPIRTEIDPLPAMAEMARHGPVGVPVILGDGQPLEFRRWDEKTAMEPGPFGAVIPINSEIVVPKVLIVPLVAFDRQGHRLGYGGGFYDRSLELLRGRGDILAVGFAYADQQVEDLPTEPTDQVLDAVVTDQGVITFA